MGYCYANLLGRRLSYGNNPIKRILCLGSRIEKREKKERKKREKKEKKKKKELSVFLDTKITIR